MEPIVLLATLITGMSLFIVWIFGFSHDEDKAVQDGGMVIITDEHGEDVEESAKDPVGKNQALSQSSSLKENSLPTSYPTVWCFQAKFKANFKWPQDAGTLVKIQKRTEGATQLSTEMQSKLQDIGIFRENSALNLIREDIAEVARETGILMPRKRLNITFDMFSKKKRPGLSLSSEDEDSAGLEKKKKKKKEETARRNEEITKWKNQHTNLFQQEKADLLKFVKAEKQSFTRSP